MRITFSVVLVTAFLAGVVPVLGGHDDPPPPYTGDQQPANPQTTKGSSFWSTLRSPFSRSSSRATTSAVSPPAVREPREAVEVHIVPLYSTREIVQNSDTTLSVTLRPGDHEGPGPRYKETPRHSIKPPVHYLHFMQDLPDSCAVIVSPMSSYSLEKVKILTAETKSQQFGEDIEVAGYSNYRVKCWWN